MAPTVDRPTEPGVSPDAIARAPRRLEGRDKVTGRVRYAGDMAERELGRRPAVAVAITATQASGRILSIDAAEALAAPGVRLLVTHENAPRLHKVQSLVGAEIADLLPLQDDRVRYGGQCVALLVADTWENARDAAHLVRVHYSAPEAGRAFTLDQGRPRAEDITKVTSGDEGQVTVGDAERAYAAAPVKIDATFGTPPHHHHAMEPGAIVAEWHEDGGLTVRVPTQTSYLDAVNLGQAFGFGLKDRLPRLIGQVLGGFEFDNKVRVIAPMAGGAFGSKISNVHLLLAPMAAKLVGGPVKLVLSRADVFTLMPFRAGSWQRLRLAADADGQLRALIQHSIVSLGAAGQYIESAGETVAKAYAIPNMRLRAQSARLDTPAPGWMRGPGSCLGRFASETAMDMLADRLGMDPLAFRLLNYAEVEPDTGHEWSSKALRECYQVAAEAIGWSDRDPRVGAMREGRHLVGFGMATSIYPVKQMPAAAKVTLDRRGRAVIQTSTHEIGQGTITAMTQLGAEALGLPLDHVTLEFGDTALPYGGMAAASTSTLSTGAAVDEAARMVRDALIKRAVGDQDSPLHRRSARDLTVADGRVVAPDGASERVADLMGRHPETRIEKEAITGRDFGRSKYGRLIFGAQFAKVLVDPDTRHIQLERLVGAVAGGRIVNPLLARSQVMGGMVWGVGQALMEESAMDPRSGLFMNRSLGEALVPTNADIDRLDVILLEEDDTRGSPLGIKGMGEIGGIGTAAAIGNAIFHATGVRLTELPFRVDGLLGTERAGGG